MKANEPQHTTNCPLFKDINSFVPNYPLNGGFYVLKNIQMMKGEPDFVDIWILMRDVKDKEATNMMKSLHELNVCEVNYWHKEMLYPYTRRFLLWDDLKQHLTGICRMIEYRCFY